MQPHPPIRAVVTVDLRIIGKKAVRNDALAPAEAEWDETQRYASLKGIMAAKKKEIKEVSLAELGVTPEQAAVRTRDGGEGHIDTIGWKVANRDLTPRQGAARSLSSR
mgnify:CR=1 FL=1